MMKIRNVLSVLIVSSVSNAQNDLNELNDANVQIMLEKRCEIHEESYEIHHVMLISSMVLLIPILLLSVELIDRCWYDYLLDYLHHDLDAEH